MPTTERCCHPFLHDQDFVIEGDDDPDGWDECPDCGEVVRAIPNTLFKLERRHLTECMLVMYPGDGSFCTCLSAYPDP